MFITLNYWYFSFVFYYIVKQWMNFEIPASFKAIPVGLRDDDILFYTRIYSFFFIIQYYKITHIAYLFIKRWIQYI